MSISLFKKGKVTQSGGGGGGTGDGTFANPYDWSQVSTGADKTIVDKVDMISVKPPWSNYGMYVRVNLTAGTEYRLFMNSEVTDTLIAIYNADAPDEESSIEINDDWDEAGSCLYFTPTATGDYLILYTSYPRFLEGETEFSTTIDEASVTPAPNIITVGDSEITYTYETSSGFDAFGYPMKYDTAFEAGCKITSIPDGVPVDGLAAWFPLRANARDCFSGFTGSVIGEVDFSNNYATGWSKSKYIRLPGNILPNSTEWTIGLLMQKPTRSSSHELAEVKGNNEGLTFHDVGGWYHIQYNDSEWSALDAPPLSQWTLIVVANKPSDGKMRMYVNGSEWRNSSSKDVSITNPITIGVLDRSGDIESATTSTTKMKHLFLYQKALSADEVTTLHTALQNSGEFIL